MILKVVDIGGVPVPMAASADTPRKYRIKYGEDILSQLQKMDIEAIDTTALEQLAYIMALQAQPGLEMTIDEWLDQFPMFAVMDALPQIMEIWNMNTKGTSTSKKKSKR